MATTVIPGPTERIPWIGSARAFAANPPEFLAQAARTYGPISRLTLFGQVFYLVAQPDLVREVLVGQYELLPKTERDIEILSRAVGKGLLTSSGAEHRQQRRLVQPAFHTGRIAEYGEIMVSYAAQMADGWQSGEQIDMNHQMMQLTMFIIAKTLFDAEPASMAGEADTIGEAIHVIQETSNAEFKSPVMFPRWLPTPRNRRRQSARAVLDETIDRIIQERRLSDGPGLPQDRGDLLSMLLLTRDETGGRLGPAEIRDQLVTFFVAGHETTSNALTWAWYLLARHPEAEALLHEEVRTVLGGRLPTVDDLPRLTYTEMGVKEAMRLYPPAWILSGRVGSADIALGPYHLPAGSAVFISPYAMHRLPDYFSEPDRFVPERFTAAKERELPRYAYIPFGAGPRVCIGNHFAMLEVRLILATIAQRFRFALPPGHEVVLNPQITLSPRDGLCMRVRSIVI